MNPYSLITQASIILLLFSAISLEMSADRSCDEEFVLVGTLCYKFDYANLGAFDTQLERCQKLGTGLIEPPNREEYQKLVEYLIAKTSWPFWIGLKATKDGDNSNASSYHWISNDLPNVQFPSRNEPWRTPFPRNNPTYRCVISNEIGLWRNARCHENLALACQYDPKFGRYVDSQKTTPASNFTTQISATNTGDEIKDNETTTGDTNSSGNKDSPTSSDIGSSESVFSETAKSSEKKTTSLENIHNITDNSIESTTKNDITLSGFENNLSTIPGEIEIETLHTEDSNVKTKETISTLPYLSTKTSTNTGNNLDPEGINETHLTSKSVTYPTKESITKSVDNINNNKSSPTQEILTEVTTLSSYNKSTTEEHFESSIGPFTSSKDGEEVTKSTPKGDTSKGSKTDKETQEDIKKLLIANGMSEEDLEQIEKDSSLFAALHRIRSDSITILIQNIKIYNPAVSPIKFDPKKIGSLDKEVAK